MSDIFPCQYSGEVIKGTEGLSPCIVQSGQKSLREGTDILLMNQWSKMIEMYLLCENKKQDLYKQNAVPIVVFGIKCCDLTVR